MLGERRVGPYPPAAVAGPLVRSPLPTMGPSRDLAAAGAWEVEGGGARVGAFRAGEERLVQWQVERGVAAAGCGGGRGDDTEEGRRRRRVLMLEDGLTIDLPAVADVAAAGVGGLTWVNAQAGGSLLLCCGGGGGHLSWLGTRGCSASWLGSAVRTCASVRPCVILVEGDVVLATLKQDNVYRMSSRTPGGGAGKSMIERPPLRLTRISESSRKPRGSRRLLLALPRERRGERSCWRPLTVRNRGNITYILDQAGVPMERPPTLPLNLTMTSSTWSAARSSSTLLTEGFWTRPPRPR